MAEQSNSCRAAGDKLYPGWKRCVLRGTALTVIADHYRAVMLFQLKAGWNVVQNLCDIVSQFLKLVSTAIAGRLAGGMIDCYHLSPLGDFAPFPLGAGMGWYVNGGQLFLYRRLYKLFQRKQAGLIIDRQLLRLGAESFFLRIDQMLAQLFNLALLFNDDGNQSIFRQCFISFGSALHAFSNIYLCRIIQAFFRCTANFYARQIHAAQKLIEINPRNLFLTLGPLNFKYSGFEPLVIQHVAIAIPPEELHALPFAAEEHIQSAANGAALYAFLHQCCQPVKAAPHVRGLHEKVDLKIWRQL